MKRLIACVASIVLAASMIAVAPGLPEAKAAGSSMKLHGIYMSVNSGASVPSGDWQEYGDAVLVESDGKFLLMDTGADYVSNSVVKYLKAKGVKELDVYVSHLHPDHCYGIGDLCKNFTVKNVYLPDPSIGKDWVSESGATTSDVYTVLNSQMTSGGSTPNKVYLKAGSKFSVGGVSAEVIGPVGSYKMNQSWKWPAIGEKSGHYLNNYSLTTMLTCGSVKYLTTGDIEEEEETALVAKYGKALNADILKMSHHGLNSSNIDSFLKAVTPTWSFAENMGYESPIKTSTSGQTYKVTRNYQTLQRLHNYGFAYLVGNEAASLIIDVNNGNVKLYRDKNNDAVAAAGEQLKGLVRVIGDGIVTSGANTGDYTTTNAYLLDANSVPQTGTLQVGKKWYITFPGGCFEQGSAKKSGSKYVYNGYRNYNSKGQKDANGTKLRYFSTDNSMAVGPTKIDGKWFLFDANGYRMAPSKTAKGSNFGIVTLDGVNYPITKAGFIYNYKGKSSAKLRMAGKLVTVNSKGQITSANIPKVKGVKVKKSGKKALVKWKKAKGNTKGYYVLRSTTKKGKYTVIKTIKKAKTVKYKDKKVKKGKKYYYKVQAYGKYVGFKVVGKPSAAKKFKMK